MFMHDTKYMEGADVFNVFFLPTRLKQKWLEECAEQQNTERELTSSLQYWFSSLARVSE